MNIVWSSAAEFWAMGGQGAYVWGSFAVTALALVAEVVVLRRRRRAVRRQIEAAAKAGTGHVND
ncbi:MAG: heme exporter protein CcmD [Pseudomonadota bacterium]